MSRGRREFTEEQTREIGRRIGVDFSVISIEEFRKGLAVELEHGSYDPQTNITFDNPVTTGKIALAHLKLLPDYYTRLIRMEQEATLSKKAS